MVRGIAWVSWMVFMTEAIACGVMSNDLVSKLHNGMCEELSLACWYEKIQLFWICFCKQLNWRKMRYLWDCYAFVGLLRHCRLVGEMRKVYEG